MRNIIVGTTLLIALAGCTVSEDHTKAAVEAQGLTDVVTKGYAPFACSSGKDDDESFSTAFEATAPNGRRVKGVVCAGLLKGATVRIQGYAQ